VVWIVGGVFGFFFLLMCIGIASHSNHGGGGAGVAEPPKTTNASSASEQNENKGGGPDRTALLKNREFRDGYAGGLELGSGYVQRMKMGDRSAFSDAKAMYRERVMLMQQIGDKDDPEFKHQFGIAAGIYDSLFKAGANVLALTN
jgi:hypothetical protein